MQKVHIALSSLGKFEHSCSKYVGESFHLFLTNSLIKLIIEVS